MESTVSAVFHFNCDDTKKQMVSEWKSYFNEPNDKDPVIVTALGAGDEMTKLDLIEFGYQIRDLEYIGEVICDIGLPEKLEQFLEVREYANKHSLTDAGAYDCILNA